MSEPKEPGHGARSFTLWVMSAIFVLAIIVAAVVVIVIGQTRGDPGATPSPQTSATAGVPTGPTAPVSASPTGCTLADQVSSEVPQSTPAGIEWRSTPYGALLPYSATAGPATENGAIAGCYAHSPTGALLALSHIWARATLNPIADERLAVVEAQFTDGAAKGTLRKSLGDKGSGYPWQWKAFRFQSYGPEAASIVLVYEATGQNAFFGATFRAVWQNDTWVFDSASALESTSVDVTASQLPSYIAWSAV